MMWPCGEEEPDEIRGRHLFLTGSSGIGKTTCLLSCLEPVWWKAGGFLTRRLTDKSGETMGFRLVPVEGMASPPPAAELYEPGLDAVFIEKMPEGWKKRPQVFETLGTEILDRMIKNPEKYGFCYLDEIGGVELTAEPFMERLERLLRGPLPCIGVLKASRNLASMGTRVTLSRDTAFYRDGLEERLTQCFGSRIVSFTGSEEEKSEIKCLLKRQLDGSGGITESRTGFINVNGRECEGK